MTSLQAACRWLGLGSACHLDCNASDNCNRFRQQHLKKKRPSAEISKPIGLEGIPGHKKQRLRLAVWFGVSFFNFAL
eukprot:scaffold88294_cov20-Prasinocladus_malaysianus.AAC.1